VLFWTGNEKIGYFSAKQGYKVQVEEAFVRERKWWWNFIWDSDLLWLVLENNILTWDNGLKRGWIGPNRCSLCKSEMEYVHHLFIQCPFAHHVWQGFSKEFKILA